MLLVETPERLVNSLRSSLLPRYVIGLAAAFATNFAFAHSIEGGDASFVASIEGPAIGPFIYLGAKHMVTGYDHLLFLVGVIFFLYRPVDVIKYVTLFAVGHSITLLVGVLAGVGGAFCSCCARCSLRPTDHAFVEGHVAL